MPYRQPWEIGHAHVTHLRHAAARARIGREAERTPLRGRNRAAAFVRTIAHRLSRFADRLETRPVRPARFVTSRPDGA